MYCKHFIHLCIDANFLFGHSSDPPRIMFTICIETALNNFLSVSSKCYSITVYQYTYIIKPAIKNICFLENVYHYIEQMCTTHGTNLVYIHVTTNFDFYF